MTVTKNIERILVDLTGEPQPELALQLALSDVISHRLEMVNSKIVNFEKKYKMSFSKFKKAWEIGEISAKYGYAVEKDYWEWEGFISRKNKLMEIAKWTA